MTPPASQRAAAYLPRIIAWEITRSCPLACKHCRAAAQSTPYPGELTTEEAWLVLDSIASLARPMIILTGGEPMLREDLYDLAAYAHGLGLPVAIAPCGMYVNDDAVRQMLRSGIHCISISIDGAAAVSHDDFRGVPGAFDAAMKAIQAARRGGMPFQINTTITRHNLAEVPRILDLAVRLGATTFNPFLLVPTGRGRQLADQAISPADYEKTLRWLAEQEGRKDIKIRVTCAPHYTRILHERARATGRGAAAGHTEAAQEGADAKVAEKGCLGGKAFAFISHVGKVQVCGFLDVECGDLRQADFDFRKIWETSAVMRQVRDVDAYRGKCGVCEYRWTCGGCRARAFAMTRDYLAEEPFCVYRPGRRIIAPRAQGRS